MLQEQSMPISEVNFSRPYLTGNELKYIERALVLGKLSGDGNFTKLCESFFEKRYGTLRALLTHSCTDALEMVATVVGIKPGDEVIVPSYTFVSTANAFALRGAKVIFLDSRSDHPNMNVDLLESAITDKTKIIAPVHYGGYPCDMDRIMELAQKRGIIVVEDAAHSIESACGARQLGCMGHFGTFSFHDTKNLTCGEGGALFVNDSRFVETAEIVREKGTNRASFFRGEVDKYSWVSLGSSHLPSEITASFLWAQLDELERIQEIRKSHWQRYQDNIQNCRLYKKMEDNFRSNAHLFYLQATNLRVRSEILSALKEKGIGACFHYLPLEESSFGKENFQQVSCPNSSVWSDTIVRLPLSAAHTEAEIDRVITAVNSLDESLGR